MADPAWRQNTIDGLESNEEKSFINRPIDVTLSGNKFYNDANKTIGIIALLTDVVIFADNAQLIAKRALDGDRDLPKNFNPFVPLGSSVGAFQKRYLQVSEPLQEMTLVRVIDNFTSYLSDILKECLKKSPRTLSSKETMTFESILQHDNLEDLIDSMVARKVDELAYLGFDRLSEWFDDRLGIHDLRDFPAKLALVEVIEARNCVVHNRAIASKKYNKAAGAQGITVEIGSAVPINIDLVLVATQACAECVGLIEERLIKKFSLPLFGRGSS